MKLELNFILKKNELPLDYRRLFISFLKSCLSNGASHQYMEKYYTPGIEKEYSFAIFFKNPIFSPKKIQTETNQVKMIFSTANKYTGFIFYAAFLESRNKSFPMENGNNMTLIKIKELLQPKVVSDQILVQTVSPLCIRNHNPDTNRDYYYSYSHEDFKKTFVYVIKRQLERAGFSGDNLTGLNIEPIHCKKVIIKHYDCNVESTIGKFMVEGKTNVLQYLLNAGAGSRKSGGFGLLELLSNG